MEGRQNRRLELGRRGEEAAVRWLKRRGFRVVERGYRRLRGEIDIIARDGETLVFIEVKTRAGSAFGSPEESVTPGKASQIRKIAQAYLVDRGLGDPPCRFDVLAVEAGVDGALTIRHIPDAF